MAPPGRVRFRSIDKAGIGRDLDREITRKTRFDDRQDVPKSRLDRSKIQRDEYIDFKNDPTKTKAVNIIDPVTGKVTGTVTNLFQAATPGGKTLAEKEMELAQKYGPTMSEIAGDITYRSGKIVGALGEKALSGGLGFLAVVKDIFDYATNKGNKNYDKLNDVEKEIYDNPDKHPLTSKGLPSLKEIAQSTDLINKAEKDALGLQIDRLIANRNFRRTPGTGYQAGAGLTTLPTPEISIDFPTRDPVFPAEQIKQSALDRFSPEYLEQQKALLDELNISPQVAELLDPNAPGGREQQFRIDPQDQDEGGTQVTAFNNPVNLTDVGQAGTTGETYGNNFAVFPNAETGILAAKRDLALKTDRYDGSVDKIIGEFSPREDNPDSFDNYVNFVKQGVGDRVDPGEEDELLKRVIQFENKPDIAQQYLALVAEGGLMDKKMYGGIIASKG
jgi:hypothetical protein